MLSSRGLICPFSSSCFRWTILFAWPDPLFFALFPSFTLSSLRPDDRSKGCPAHFSDRLFVSRCVSRGEGHSKRQAQEQVIACLGPSSWDASLGLPDAGSPFDHSWHGFSSRR